MLTKYTAAQVCDRIETRGQREQYVLYSDLKAAGCLFPVVDGEPCEMEYLPRHHFILWDGHVWAPGRLHCEMVRITDNFRVNVVDQYREGFKFQPVKLVPITEVNL